MDAATNSLEPTAPRPARSNTIWWVLLAAHLVWITATAATEPLLAAVGIGNSVLVLLLWFARARGVFVSFAPVISFVWLNLFTFGFSNILYVKFTNFSLGFGGHELLAQLTALHVACAVVGALLTHFFIGRDDFPTRAPPIIRRWQTLAVTGFVFAATAVAHVATGWLNARFDESTEPSFGAAYFVQGLGMFGLVFFFVLGTHLPRRLDSVRGVAILTLVAVLALLQALSGGRGISLFLVLLLLAGGLWGHLTAGQVRLMALIAVLVGIPFAIAVGDARSHKGFAYGTLSDRAEQIGQAAERVSDTEASDESPMDSLISRLFEPSAATVVAQVSRVRRFAGFEDFDRLQYAFVPKALAPHKLPLSNGTEILIREFGYKLDERTGVPICLVADSFRRGGELWVAVVGLLAGAALRLQSRIVRLVLGSDLTMLYIALFVLTGTGVHGESVLGFANAMTYLSSKLLLLFVALATMIRILIAMTEPQTPTLEMRRPSAVTRLRIPRR